MSNTAHWPEFYTNCYASRHALDMHVGLCLCVYACVCVCALWAEGDASV
jgi:hypothetical protein